MEYTSSGNKRYRSFIYLYIIVIYACIFIIPSSAILGEVRELPYPKFIFYGFTILMALVVLKRLKFYDLLICFLAVALAVVTRSLTSLSWISTVVLCRLLTNGEGAYIKKVVKDTWMNYVSLFFIILYSVIYGFQTFADGEYQLVRTAVYEVNQSGLAILCLGLIIKARHCLIGNLVICFGMLGLSRNYILAFIVLIILNHKKILNILSLLYNKGILKFTTIIAISTAIVIGLGILYIAWWTNGEITHETGAARINNFKDYSNFYRFSTNVAFFKMMQENPLRLLIGYSDINSYKMDLQQVASSLNIISVGNTPHNFMISYLRLYGISSVILVIYISKTLNYVINKYNIGIYLAICLYPIFMSAGFNTWWLYLTVFTLLVYSDQYIGENSKYRIQI